MPKIFITLYKSTQNTSCRWNFIYIHFNNHVISFITWYFKNIIVISTCASIGISRFWMFFLQFFILNKFCVLNSIQTNPLKMISYCIFSFLLGMNLNYENIFLFHWCAQFPVPFLWLTGLLVQCYGHSIIYLVKFVSLN